MNQPRRHHIAPEFYLRGFADERLQVRVVSRDDTTRHYVSNVDNATVHKDFYALEFEDGKDQVIETDLLGEVETEAAPALQ